MTGRWLRVACIVYFDDFGISAERESKEASLKAVSRMGQISGFAIKVEKWELGYWLEFLCVAITCRVKDDTCKAHSPPSPDRVAKLIREVALLKMRTKYF